MTAITCTETGNTYATHADYIAHLKTLDAAYYTGLRALGFKKRGNLMVHAASGVKVNRLGFEDGYLIRFHADEGATEPTWTAYANTVDETNGYVDEIAALV